MHPLIGYKVKKYDYNFILNINTNQFIIILINKINLNFILVIQNLQIIFKINNFENNWLI